MKSDTNAEESRFEIGRSGPTSVAHAELSPELLSRIHSIHNVIQAAYDATLEQFETAFMLDDDPDGEVVLWEQIAASYERVIASLPAYDRRATLETVLGYSMDLLTADEREEPEVRRILEIIDRK